MLGVLGVLGVLGAMGCDAPPPPVELHAGELVVVVDSEPARIVVSSGDREIWRTEAGGDGGRPPHSFAAISRKAVAIQQQFGSYRFDENDAMTSWQAIDQLADARLDGDRIAFRLRAGDTDVGDGSVSVASDGRVEIELRADTGDSVSLSSPLDEVEHLVGLGGQSFEVDHRGEHVALFVQEDGIGKYPDEDDNYQGVWFLSGRRHSTHTPMPMLLSSRGYALVVDTNARAVFDLGKERADSARYEAWERTLRVELFAGATARASLGRMIAWTGKASRPPDAVFAPWVDAVFGAANVRQVAAALRANGVSASVIWTEDWVGGNDTSTGYALAKNWRVDRTLYPDVEALASDLHDQGFAFHAYHNAFLDNTADVFPEAIANDYAIHAPGGGAYSFTGVAFGPSTLLDLTRPAARTWASLLLDETVQLGFDGWMADYGEWLPTDAVLASGEDALATHNRYPVDWARLHHELFANPPPGRLAPIYFMRSAWLHSQPLVEVMWLGDQQTDWSEGDGLPSVVPISLGLGLAGFPYTGGDIGGYASQGTTPTSEELWYRWVTLGALQPVMRTHHGRSARENFQWQHDARSIAHFRRWTRFHQQLAAYLEDSIAAYEQDGLPLMRLIALEYPDEAWAWQTGDEYLLGDRILVAPITVQGATSRAVTLPAGEWVPLFGGAHVAGGGTTATATMEDLPAYVPAGALLVLYPDGIDTVYPAAGAPGLTHPGSTREVWLYSGQAARPPLATWPLSGPPSWTWSGRATAPLPTTATFAGADVPVAIAGHAASVEVTGNGALTFSDGSTLVISRPDPDARTTVRLYD